MSEQEYKRVLKNGKWVEVPVVSQDKVDAAIDEMNKRAEEEATNQALRRGEYGLRGNSGSNDRRGSPKPLPKTKVLVAVKKPKPKVQLNQNGRAVAKVTPKTKVKELPNGPIADLVNLAEVHKKDPEALEAIAAGKPMAPHSPFLMESIAARNTLNDFNTVFDIGSGVSSIFSRRRFRVAGTVIYDRNYSPSTISYTVNL